MRLSGLGSHPASVLKWSVVPRKGAIVRVKLIGLKHSWTIAEFCHRPVPTRAGDSLAFGAQVTAESNLKVASDHRIGFD